MMGDGQQSKLSLLKAGVVVKASHKVTFMVQK
jgi:hypothetical protein